MIRHLRLDAALLVLTLATIALVLTAVLALHGLVGEPTGAPAADAAAVAARTAAG